MASSGLHRRGHHSNDNPMRSETHLERAPSEDEESLARPLLASNEPTSPATHSGGSSSSRRAASSSSSTSWTLTVRETAASVACGFMDLLPRQIQTKFLPVPLNTHVNFLDGWKSNERIALPFEKDHPDHTNLLRRLWEGSFTAMEQLTIPALPEDMKSEAWKQFGFQGVDPATDFRGGGFFSLRNLVYIATDHPKLFREFVHRADYPFAVCGINITLILITILHLQSSQTCLATKQSGDLFSGAQARCHFSLWMYEGKNGDPMRSLREREIEATEVFNEVYRLGCAFVHSEWLKSNRNLMAFNSILAEGTKKLINVLKCCETLSEALTHFPQELR